ncbi:MAG: hypothetical protein A2167_04535 [Planctomycetes bacterium RBG_13_46_10]|nr:MAG: hypothetical protein A2167_04535 [Planctomycetes bacterium RBG_13_46_10]
MIFIIIPTIMLPAIAGNYNSDKNNENVEWGLPHHTNCNVRCALHTIIILNFLFFYLFFMTISVIIFEGGTIHL